MSTRRQFIKDILVTTGGIAAGGSILSGCNDNETKKLPDYKGPHMALAPLKESGVELVGADGKTINLEALTAKMKGHYSTVSFMFAACPTVCPKTSMILKNVSDEDKSALHVVISVDPEHDFKHPAADGSGKSRLEERVKQFGLNPEQPGGNTIVLFPVGKGNTIEERLANGPGWEVQHQLDLITDGKKPEGHSGAICLYEPSGRLNNQFIGMDVDELSKKIVAEVSKGKSHGR